MQPTRHTTTLHRSQSLSYPKHSPAASARFAHIYMPQIRVSQPIPSQAPAAVNLNPIGSKQSHKDFTNTAPFPSPIIHTKLLTHATLDRFMAHRQRDIPQKKILDV